MRKRPRPDQIAKILREIQADLDPGLAAELPAAVHAEQLGDPRPLLRLAALIEGPAEASPTLNNALYIATVCGDGPMVSSASLSTKKRQRQNPSSAQAVRCASAPYQIPESAGARNREPMGEE